MIAFALFLSSVVVSCTPLSTSLSRDQTESGTLRLLSDVEGEIKAVALSANSARRAALRNADLVSHLVNALPSPVEVGIIVNDRSAFVVSNNPWPNRIHFLEVPFLSPITIWTQDPFLVLRDGERTVLLSPNEFDRADDSLMAEKIAAEFGYETRQSELFFEGGNIVSDNRNAFIGANTIRFNALRSERSEVEVVKQFQLELGLRVVVVGPYPQPVAHIDMILTPLGDGRIAVADASLGGTIVKKELEENPGGVAAFERKAEKLFFGHEAIEKVVGRDGEELRAPKLKGQMARMIDLTEAISSDLDGIASALSNYGYRVERVPFLFGGPEVSWSRTKELTPAFPMITYNNVLLEERSGKRIVYLPRYGLSSLDKAATEAWTKIGYLPHPVNGLTTSAMYGGALRCSAKVLERN